MFTTLNKIRSHNPCREGWQKLMKSLGKTRGDDEPVSLLAVLDSNGLDDAIWCLQAVDGVDSKARLFAVACAREVQHLLTDPRSLNALDVAERFAKGFATTEELAAARDAAWNAAYTACAARAAAYTAGDAAYATYTACAARAAAYTARDAASAAAWNTASAACAAASVKQEHIFREIFK
jgi:hypothetical protein